MDFNGKVAVITGGASGIGAACARFFANRYGRVLIADRRFDAAKEVAARLGGTAIELDVGNDESINRAVSLVEAEFGIVDALINSAGILQRTLPPEHLSITEWDMVMRINLRGTYLCCAKFGAGMAKRGRGAIVNIASVSGMRSGPLHSYGPAKAGVIHLTECLAAEWGPRGVRVNSVSPGFTQTPALEKGIETRTLDIGNMSENSAMGRLVHSDEIAAAVGFLSSDLASGITGVNLPVDAGYLIATPWASFGGLRRD